MRRLTVATTMFMVLALAVPALGTQETCPEGDGWVKVNGLTGETFTFDVPDGYRVDENCYKAGTRVVFGSGPTVTSFVTNQNGKIQDLSHASFRLVKKAEPTVTSTCDSVLITDGDEAGWYIQIGDGFESGTGGKYFYGDPGQAWAVSHNEQVIASGVFTECTPTTTVPEETTTTWEDTTTTSTVTTQPSTTTTPTTTTTPESPTTTSPVTTSAPTTTNPAPSTTASTPSELPLTGPSALVGLGTTATALVALGSLLVRRREDG